MRYNMPAHHFDTAAYRRRTMAARYFLLAAVIVLVLGVVWSFAGQSGIAIQNRLVNHQHTASGDGGLLQGLAPVGNFKISGNNAGNISISTSITGSNFIWKPSSTSFLAGQATDDSFYVNNIGGFSWIGGYNAMSRGDYSLSFGTYTKNYRAASVLLGYYLKNNAGNSVMIGSGPGFGPQPYAVNDDTGSIKFFPFTTTSETRPMLNMKRDNTAEAVGVWNFISTPTILGVSISTYAAVDTSKVLKTGDTMSGDLYAPAINVSSLTVAGSTFTVNPGGYVKIGRPISSFNQSLTISAAEGTPGASLYLGTFNNNTASVPQLGFLRARSGVAGDWTNGGLTGGELLGQILTRGSWDHSNLRFATRWDAVLVSTTASGFSARQDWYNAMGGVSVDATPVISINEFNNVGISTRTPQATLDVNGTVKISGGLRISSVTISGTGSPAIGAALCLTASGRLGTCTGGTFDACTCTAP